VSYLLFLGFVQGTLLAFACFHSREKNPVGFESMSALSLCLALVVLEQWADSLGLNRAFPHLSRLTTWMPFLFGPLFFLACRSLSRDATRLERADAWHFVPAGLYLLYLLPFYLSPGSEKVSTATAIPLETTVVGTAKILHLLAYLLVTRSRLPARTGASHLARFLGRAVDGFLLIAVLLVFWFYAEQAWGELWVGGDQVAALLITFLFLGAAYGFLVHWRGFVLEQAGEATGAAATDQHPGPDFHGIYAEIESHLRERKLYRQPELRIEDVARAVRKPLHLVSLAVNQGGGRNFATLVNEMRVNYVQRRLARGTAASRVLDVAFEAGFNSKASFNRVFKRVAGVTPSEYLEQVSESSPDDARRN